MADARAGGVGRVQHALGGLFRQAGDIVEAVARIAADRGVSRAQVALAWVLAQEALTAPIVGATKEHHLDDAIAGTGHRTFWAGPGMNDDARLAAMGFTRAAA